MRGGRSAIDCGRATRRISTRFTPLNSAAEITRNRSAYWLFTRSRARLESASIVSVLFCNAPTRSGLIQLRHAASPRSTRIRTDTFSQHPSRCSCVVSAVSAVVKAFSSCLEFCSLCSATYGTNTFGIEGLFKLSLDILSPIYVAATLDCGQFTDCV